MARAVLFDWGDTLVRVEWNEEIAKAGSSAGLAEVGRAGLPDAEAIDLWFKGRAAQLFYAASLDEIDLTDVCRRCFLDLGCELSDDELERYMEASDRYWCSRYEVHEDAPRVLDALRQRGFKVAIVSNSATPRRFLDRTLGTQGLLERVDLAVFSCDVGKRKPHPAIFQAALNALGVGPGSCVFVGDRLYEDVRGAGELGMTTVQALWFREDEHPEGGEPDFRAGNPLEVLEYVGA